MDSKLTIDSPEIVAFLKSWVAPFGRKTRAVERRKYIALDCDNGPNSWSGCFLVDRVTRRVYTIKGYGVRGYDRGSLEEMTTTALAASRVRQRISAEMGGDLDCTSDADSGL
jgi:hypothetical protein